MSVKRASQYTVEQVAAIIQADPESVRRWIRDGDLDAWFTGYGPGRGHRVDHNALERFVKARYGPFVRLDIPE